MTLKKKTAAKSNKRAKKPNSAAKKTTEVKDTKKPRIKVLIADDHSVVREGLGSLITWKADMIVIAEAGKGLVAANLLKQHLPDLTLLDLRMPKLAGIGVMNAIRIT